MKTMIMSKANVYLLVAALCVVAGIAMLTSY